MRKRILAASIICPLLFGCAKNDEKDVQNGFFLSLTEAYYLSYLDKDALQNIAFYWNGKLNLNDADFVPTNVSVDELDELTVNAIKQTHVDRIIERYPNASVNNVRIDAYYGSYRRAIAVKMAEDFAFCGGDPIAKDDCFIGGVRFSNCFNEGYNGINVWIKR